MTIKLVPITPVTIDILALRLTAEEKYDAQKWQEFENKPAELINITPITITNLNILSVFFNIPEKSAINSKDVKYTLLRITNHIILTPLKLTSLRVQNDTA